MRIKDILNDTMLNKISYITLTFKDGTTITNQGLIWFMASNSIIVEIFGDLKVATSVLTTEDDENESLKISILVNSCADSFLMERYWRKICEKCI